MHAEQVKIELKDGEESSGLAMMLSQYLEQNIRDFRRKDEQARKIHGKLALEALEGNVGVTLSFNGGEIEIADGCAADARIFVQGGIFAITELATGGAHTIAKIGRGELKVRSAWKHPVFAFRVARFMSLPEEIKSEHAAPARPLGWKLAVGAGGAVAAIGLAAYFLSR